MSRRKSRGFTMVELLMVILIIGLLMSLLMNAVQSSREAGRKSVCLSRMREVANAVLSCEQAQNGFPGWNHPVIGTNNATNPPQLVRYHEGWINQLLPYLGRNDLYAAVQPPAQGTTKTPFFDASGNLTGLSRPSLNNTLLCHGDFDALQLGFPDNPTSFVCNAGREDAQATAQIPADWRTNAVFMNRDDSNGRRVEITDTSFIRNGDGLATTIMLSENLDALSWHNPNLGVNPGFPPGGNWYPEWYSGIIFWPPGANGLPPKDVHRINGPKVNVTTPYDTARPSSTHPGGVNMLFTDGHGRFVRQDIDYTVYCALMTPKGANAMNPGGTNASNNQIRNQPKLTPDSF